MCQIGITLIYSFYRRSREAGSRGTILSFHNKKRCGKAKRATIVVDYILISTGRESPVCYQRPDGKFIRRNGSHVQQIKSQ